MQFWLDSLYVAIASPGSAESSVLVLHVDGLMWITNSVFQGAGNNSRAIDVTSKDEGLPSAFIQGTTITGFTRDLAPGITVWHNASLVLKDVAFKNLQLLPRVGNVPVPGVSLGVFAGAGVLMQDVTFDNNTVYGKPADFQEVAIEQASLDGPAAVAYSVPPFQVWPWPEGPPVRTDSISNSSNFANGFLGDRGPLAGIQAERQGLINQSPDLPPLAPPRVATSPALGPGLPEAVPEAGAPAPEPAAGASTASPPPLPPRPQRPPPVPLPLPPALPVDGPTTVTNNSGGNSESVGGGAAGAAVGAEAAGADADEDDDDDVPVGLVVACSVAAVVAVALCVTATALFMLRRQRQQQHAQQPPPANPPPQLEEPQAAVGSWRNHDYKSPAGKRGPE